MSSLASAGFVLGQASRSTFDEGCTDEKPARCPRPDPYQFSPYDYADVALAGKCEKDYSTCPIAQICHRSERSYQCPEGICEKRFGECPNKNLDCKYNE